MIWEYLSTCSLSVNTWGCYCNSLGDQDFHGAISDLLIAEKEKAAQISIFILAIKCVIWKRGRQWQTHRALAIPLSSRKCFSVFQPIILVYTIKLLFTLKLVAQSFLACEPSMWSNVELWLLGCTSSSHTSHLSYDQSWELLLYTEEEWTSLSPWSCYGCI